MRSVLVILVIVGIFVALTFSAMVIAGNDDSNEREVAAEWVNDYSQNPYDLSNLRYSDDEAEAFLQ